MWWTSQELMMKMTPLETWLIYWSLLHRSLSLSWTTGMYMDAADFSQFACHAVIKLWLPSY